MKNFFLDLRFNSTSSAAYTDVLIAPPSPSPWEGCTAHNRQYAVVYVMVLAISHLCCLYRYSRCYCHNYG